MEPKSEHKIGYKKPPKEYNFEPKHTPEEYLQFAEAYVQFCKDEDNRPNMAGFYLHAKIDKATFWRFEQKYPLNPATQLLNAFIEDWCVQTLNKYPAGSFIQLKQPRTGWIDQAQLPERATQNIQINFIGEGTEARKARKMLKKNTIKLEWTQNKGWNYLDTWLL